MPPNPRFPRNLTKTYRGGATHAQGVPTHFHPRHRIQPVEPTGNGRSLSPRLTRPPFQGNIGQISELDNPRHGVSEYKMAMKHRIHSYPVTSSARSASCCSFL